MSFTKNDRKIRSTHGNTFPSDHPVIASSAFATSIATALRTGFGGNHGAVKAVVALTGANERAVKNWFSAKNGPSGEHLIALLRHSDDVLETVLLMAGRDDVIKVRKITEIRNLLRKMLNSLDDMESNRE